MEALSSCPNVWLKVSGLTVNTTGAATFAGAIGTDIGTVTVANSNGVAFNGAVSAATVDIVDTTNGATVSFVAGLTLTTGLQVTGTDAYTVSITGSANSIAGNTTFNNTGSLTLGDEASDSLLFAGGLTANAAGQTRAIAGTVATTDSAMTLGDLTLSAAATLKTQGSASGATLALGNVTGQGNALSPSRQAPSPAAARSPWPILAQPASAL